MDHVEQMELLVDNAKPITLIMPKTSESIDFVVDFLEQMRLESIREPEDKQP